MNIPRVDGTIYCPLHQGEDPFFEINGRRLLNTFDRVHLPVEDPDYAERAGELITGHLKVMIEEEWIQNTLLDFLAYLVQNPGRKIRWLPCIQSAEGTGKGFLSKILMGVLGVGNVKVVSPEIIRSQWNDWMIGAQLYVLEEIHFPGERREAVMAWPPCSRWPRAPAAALPQSARLTSWRRVAAWPCCTVLRTAPALQSRQLQ
jgi:hypothetical protein